MLTGCVLVEGVLAEVVLGAGVPVVVVLAGVCWVWEWECHIDARV